jgi:hypothetical protein
MLTMAEKITAVSFEISCPHCRAALLVEPGTSSCYACGQMIEVEAPVNSVVRSDAAERVVRFLRGLLFDGELSGDEVWSLANWLNKQQREVCQDWPANVLIPLLQNVYEDGELSAEEMVAIANALVNIEREWTTRFAPVEDADEKLLSPLPSQARTQSRRPLLPALRYATKVQSSSGNGEYVVDLTDHSCNCADWVSWRRTAPPQDYKRVCKHIASLYHSLETGDGINDPMFAAFVDDHWERDRGTLPQDDWTLEVVKGKPILYGFSPGKPWVNVFVPDGATYQRYGFNKEERRWSYGESPKGFAKYFRQKFQAV